MQNLGMVKFLSVHGGYLQSWSDPYSVHASNPNQNEEETWYLIEVDKGAHIYSLVSWKYGRVLSKGKGPNNSQIIANRTAIGDWEKFRLIPGQQHGIPGNKVVFQSIIDNWTMATNQPGDNYPGLDGEVYSSNGQITTPNPGWAAWWDMTAVTQPPTPGSNILTAIEGVGNLLETAATIAATASVYADLLL